MKTGENQQTIKRSNRALILKLICTGRGHTRIDLSRLTGLSKMTVTNITALLMKEGLIREGSARGGRGGAGRRAVVLEPCEDALYAVGVYLSRDFVKVSLLSLSARILRMQTVRLGEGETERSLEEKILKMVGSVEKDVPAEKIAGIGVASIGPLDIHKGVILAPPDFYGIHDVPIREFLQKKIGLPVFLNNDMKASALAERLYGKGSDTRNFIYLGITHGVGSGIIMDGALYNGEMGYSGEIGHTSINFEGPECSCGNRGCLEVYASIPNVIKSARESIADYPGTVLEGKRNLTFRLIAENAEKDRLCGETIDRLAMYVGTALVNTVNTLDISHVILGHEGVYGGKRLVSGIQDYINERILFKANKQVQVEISRFYDECPAVGSGVLVLDSLFS